jgi:hypothetical protein
MMDLTASERDLRCDRIRDLIVAQQPTTVGRVIEILQSERSALTGVTRWSAIPVRARSDGRHTVTADDDGFGSYLRKPWAATARFNKPRTYLYHCESHRGLRGEVIVT